jgi:hypothetical protein
MGNRRSGGRHKGAGLSLRGEQYGMAKIDVNVITDFSPG